MEREAEWEKEEEEGSLVRTRKGKSLNVQDESRSVYLDEEEGIWKCRHCSWNYRMGSHGMDHVHSHEEYARGVVNAKTLSQLGSCFFSPSKGTESTEGNAGTNFSTVARANAENNHGNGEADLEINNLDTLKGLSNVQNDRSQIDMRVQSKIGSNGPSLEKTKFTSVIESADENLPQKVKMNGLQSCNETPQKDVVDSAEKNFEAVEITYIDDGKSPMNMKTESQLDSTFIDSKGYGESGMTALEPVKEVIGESSHGILVHSVKEVIGESSHGILVHSGKTIVEMDVERVLEEQDTHDLYCPHCNSCITRRVILSKRKRTMGGVPSGTKRERTEPLLQPGFSESPAATDEASHDTCPDVFTCLSCFSIFIPTADGFKSFWISRRNTEGENLQSPHQTPAKNLNWISAIFEPFRAKNTRNEPGRETSECVQEDNFQASDQFQNASETQTGVKIQGELIPGKYKANAAENVGSETKKPSQETSQGPSEPGETRQVANGLKWNGLIKLNGTVVSNRQPVKGDVNEEQKHPSVRNNGNEFASPVSETPLVTDDQNSGGKVPQVGGNSVIMSIPGVLSPNGVLIIDKRPQDVATPAVPEADSIQPVEEGIVSTEGVVSSQNNQTLSSSPASGVSTGGETIIDLPQQEVDTTRRHEWDILKSVVYGGLVESVTSLGVVSSAAGSDANTLNIVALGLANLIGGLFVIAHNLREIRKEQVISSDQNEERLDRYQETLGRREKLRRHVVAAVLSYIIFGLIPPTVYGFSFRQSDNREYKMIAVAAASLACIALLAIGKAHVGRAPRTYFKTLSFYISIGVTASGISYVAGQLLNQLLEKLGLFDSSSPASLASLFLDSNSSTGLAAGWASS